MSHTNLPIIRKLPENVVNKIAAGEIIQRPVNALKELLENSLDAKSTLIQVSINAGGFKLLQIQDNGIGIRKEDLSIVCERFTTSKLEKFEDLSSISTYGFRGEALSSISHIAHLTIITRTYKDTCAYKAVYENGILKDNPKSCAGNYGTTITVEDLFYNLPQRLKVMKSSNEEFQKISDLIGKYAIHNSSKAGFVLKKSGEIVIRTSSQNSKAQNIQIIYGGKLSKQLFEINYECNVFNFKMEGCISDVNYSTRKSMFLFFVNHRLVDSNVLKTEIDEVYSKYLPKGHYPFVYISLELDPSTVDVNIHPTKHEVKFLNDDEIISKIKQQIEIKLNGSENARIFYKESKMINSKDKTLYGNNKVSTESEKHSVSNVIRTDCKEQKLEKFFILPSEKSLIGGEEERDKSFSIKEKQEIKNNSFTNKKQTKLTSVLDMRRKIEINSSPQLKKVLKESVFVGVVDRNYSLFQFESRLLLCDTIEFCREIFYQQLVYNFQNMKEYRFKVPLSIHELSMIALDSKESQWTEEDGSKTVLANRVVEILESKKAIMKEYFSLKINTNGELETIPILLDNYKPSMCHLPIYVLRLATEVEWDTEEECFETFCRETANFYSRVSIADGLTKNYKQIIEHVVYPALRNNTFLPNNKLKQNLFELTRLQNLYKVFERC